MPRVPRRRSLGLWLAAAAVAACGPLGQTATEHPTLDPNARYQAQQAPSPGAETGVLGLFPFLATVELTPVQTQRLTAIIQPLMAPDPQVEQLATQAKAILTAPTLDTDALRAALTTAETRQRALATRMIGVLAAVRAELTASQRQAASQTVLGAPSLAASPEPQAGPPGLSAEQRALFLAARPAPLSAAAASQALAQFLLEGDEAAYEAATGPKRSVSEQVEAHLKAIASLSAAQRQALFR